MADPLAGQSGSAHIDHGDRTARTAVLVDRLHAIVTELEEMYPGRKFPLDGHLVGSIGEAATEALFDLTLVAASSKPRSGFSPRYTSDTLLPSPWKMCANSSAI